MRKSLEKSLEDTPAQGFERYPKGSIVLCNACAQPVFKLDQGIALGDRLGRMAQAFKPLTLADLDGLAQREDIDAGVRATLRGWTLEQRLEHVRKLREIRSGDPATCPSCGACFLQVLEVEKHAVLDKAYAVEMLTVPPLGWGRPAPLRGKQLGAGPGKEWIH